ncbi:MAG: T9SS type A sorting domain-containing protein, partial [Bacteroidales bacterium]
NTYSWTGATTSTNREITVETTGIYYLEVEDVNGCRGMDSVNLYKRPVVDATIAVSNSVVCSETSVTATVTGATTTLFNYTTSGDLMFRNPQEDDNTITGVVVNPGNMMETLAIQASAEDQYGCTIVLKDTIEVKPLPATPAIAGFEDNNVEITICYDANFVYEVTPLENVQWYNSSYTAISAQPSTVGKYHAVTILNGCISPDTLTLTLAKTSQPTIAATITPIADQCFTTPSNVLSSTVNVTLSGYDVAHSWNYGSNTATQEYTAMAPGAYIFVDTIRVTSQDGLACQAQAIVSDTVNVWSLPLQPVITAANFVNDSILICSEEEANYTVSGTNLTFYAYDKPQTAISQPTEAGHYIVSAENEYGCVSELDYYIYTIETPALTVTEMTPNGIMNTMYCADADVANIVIQYATAENNLTGVTYNYKWNNVTSLVDTFKLETTNSTTTTFEVTATRTLNSKNCVSTAVKDTLVVLFIEKPAAPITTTSVYYCPDSTLVLPTITPALGTNYVWVGRTTAPTMEGTYQLVDTLIAAPYCVSDTVTMVITKRERPVVQINNGDLQLITCVGGAGYLRATPGFATYQWFQNGYITHRVELISFSSAIPNTNYFAVIATDEFNCGAIDSITVVTYANPTVEITPNDTTICFGSNTTLIAQGSDAGTYLWNNGTQSANLTVNVAGNYSVIFTDEHTCTATDTSTITTYSLPTVMVEFADSLICKMDSITLVANATSQTSNSFIYYWTYGIHTDTMFTSIYKVFPDSIASNVYPAQAITSYTVAVEDEHGCVSAPAQGQTTTITKHNYPIFMINPESRHLTINVNEPANFSMIIDDRCWNQNEKVFMHYQFLLNGEVLPADSITRCLQNIITQTGVTSTEWNSRYLFDVTDCSALYNPNNPSSAYLTSYHKSSVGHIPNGRFLNDGYDYDWLYLYFLSNRNIDANMSKFLKPGVYTIVYDIVKAGAGAQIWNQTMDGTLIIGGTNSDATLNGAYVVIASDTMTIEVVGAAIPAPEVPSSMAPSINKPTASIYPNPAVDNINVIINGVRGNTTIRIADMNGKVINAETVNITNDYYKYERSLNGLSQGIYFINIMNNDAVMTKKLIINE